MKAKWSPPQISAADARARARLPIRTGALTASQLSAELGLPQVGDDGGLLHANRDELLRQAALDEGRRAAEADQRDAMSRASLDEMRGRVAEARHAELWADPTPAISRFDFYMALQSAVQQHRTAGLDAGLHKHAAAHARLMWETQPDGWLTIADLDKFAARYDIGETVAALDAQLGFSGLPTQKLAALVAGLDHVPMEHREAAFVALCQSNGLDNDTPEDIRARALMRYLAQMPNSSDPILDAEREAPASAPDADAGASLPSVEDEVPHDESSEVIEEVTSPITGEPLVLELGRADANAEPLSDVDALPGPGGASFSGPNTSGVPAGFDDPNPMRAASQASSPVPARLMRIGQLGDFAEPGSAESALSVMNGADGSGATGDEGPDRPADDADAELAAASSVVMTDPTAPDQQVEVTLRPVAFSLYAIRSGELAEQIDSFEAGSMRQALALVASRIGLEGVRYPVLARADNFDTAVVVLDEERGSALQLVAAAQTADQAFDVPVPKDGQPGIAQGVKLKDGFEPESVSEFQPKPPKTKKPTDAANTPKGFKASASAPAVSAELVEAEVLAGKVARFQSADVSAQLYASADATLIVLEATSADGATTRKVAALAEMDSLVGEFQRLTRVASSAYLVRVRAAFGVTCRKCGARTDYEMPDDAVDLECPKCASTTPARAIAMAMSKRQADWQRGVVITADVPGSGDQAGLNAKRIARAIREVVGEEHVGAIWREGAQLKMRLAQWDDGQLAHIARLLTDAFNVRYAVEHEASAPPGWEQKVERWKRDSSIDNPFALAWHLHEKGVSPKDAAACAREQANFQKVAPPARRAAPAAPAAPAPMHAPGSVRVAAAQPLQPPDNGLHRYAVAIRKPGGVERVHVVAATTAEARRIASRHGAVVRAQLLGPEGPPPGPGTGSMPMSPGGPESGAGAGALLGEPLAVDEDIAGTDPAAAAAGEAAEALASDDTTAAIEAAFTHYRNTRVGILSALKQFSSAYQEFLDEYGDETSGARHTIEAEVVRVASTVYSKPTLVPPRTAAAGSARVGASGMNIPHGNNKPTMKPPKPDLGRDVSNTDPRSLDVEGRRVVPDVPNDKSRDLGDDTSNDAVDFGEGTPNPRVNDPHVSFDRSISEGKPGELSREMDARGRAAPSQLRSTKQPKG